MEECAICLTEITQSHNITTLGCCKKQMHSHCYAQCLLTKPACPMCRAEHTAIDMPEQNIRVVTVVRDYTRQTKMKMYLVSFFMLTVYILTFRNCNDTSR